MERDHEITQKYYYKKLIEITERGCQLSKNYSINSPIEELKIEYEVGLVHLKINELKNIIKYHYNQQYMENNLEKLTTHIVEIYNSHSRYDHQIFYLELCKLYEKIDDITSKKSVLLMSSLSSIMEIGAFIISKYADDYKNNNSNDVNIQENFNHTKNMFYYIELKDLLKHLIEKYKPYNDI